MIYAAISSIALFVVICVFAYRSKRRTHLLRRYEQYATIFFEDVETLLRADETPAKIVDLLEFMGQRVNDSSSALDFFIVLLRHRRRLVSKLSPSSDEIVEFRNSSPALWRVFTRASAAALLAVSYNGGVFGTLLRHFIIFDAREHEDRTRDLAAGYREIRCAA